jgi:hypothetical protein
VREAEQHLASTRAAGAQLRARLDAEAERRKDQLVAEIAALANQKKAIQTQLNQIVGIGRQAVAGSAETATHSEWPSALYPQDEALPSATEEPELSAAKAAKRKPRTKQAAEREDADEPQTDDATAADGESPDDDVERTVIRERENQ